MIIIMIRLSNCTETRWLKQKIKMNNLIKEIKQLEKSQIRKKVKARLKEFESFKTKTNEEWFSELCFCILTANSKARTAIQIQKELGQTGFCSFPEDSVKACIVRNKHRFHNNKAKYIVLARTQIRIKDKVLATITENKKNGEVAARQWLADNIKGIGFKEASHFMRNVGFKNLAILDRHILNIMVENDYLKKKPASLTRKDYLELEKIFLKIAESLNMSAAELDLYMWYMKGGDVLK
jgi:N-glycosylase/DNA lyase